MTEMSFNLNLMHLYSYKNDILDFTILYMYSHNKIILIDGVHFGF
jgi:hypothetical protein